MCFSLRTPLTRAVCDGHALPCAGEIVDSLMLHRGALVSITKTSSSFCQGVRYDHRRWFGPLSKR